jgi:hypothetical protein
VIALQEEAKYRRYIPSAQSAFIILDYLDSARTLVEQQHFAKNSRSPLSLHPADPTLSISYYANQLPVAMHR